MDAISLTLGLIILLVIIIFWVARRAKPVSSTSKQSDPIKNLLSKTMGDRALAERLIDLEKQKTPQASQADLIKAAIVRWERDNR